MVYILIFFHAGCHSTSAVLSFEHFLFVLFSVFLFFRHCITICISFLLWLSLKPFDSHVPVSWEAPSKCKQS